MERRPFMLLHEPATREKFTADESNDPCAHARQLTNSLWGRFTARCLLFLTQPEGAAKRDPDHPHERWLGDCGRNRLLLSPQEMCIERPLEVVHRPAGRRRNQTNESLLMAEAVSNAKFLGFRVSLYPSRGVTKPIRSVLVGRLLC
jgi:hypothetical protein